MPGRVRPSLQIARGRIPGQGTGQHPDRHLHRIAEAESRLPSGTPGPVLPHRGNGKSEVLLSASKWIDMPRSMCYSYTATVLCDAAWEAWRDSARRCARFFVKEDS